MATANDIIEAAYVRSTANDPGKLAVDGEMLGFTNRIFQALYALWAVSNPDSAYSLATVTLAGAPALGGLPTDMIDLARVESNLGANINVIPLVEKARTWHLAPAVYRRGASLVSRGQTGDPIVGDTLTLYVLDTPATLATLATAIDARFPVRFHELLVLEDAIYLACKDEARKAQEFQALLHQRNTLMEIFARLVGLANTALQSPHSIRGEYRPGYVSAGSGN